MPSIVHPENPTGVKNIKRRAFCWGCRQPWLIEAMTMEVQRTHVIFVFRPIYGRQLGIEILHEINGVDAMCNRMNDCKQINRKIHRNRMDVTFSAHRKLRLASPQDIDGCSLASPSSTPSVERKSCSILCGRLYWMSCTPEESSGRWWRLWLEPWHVLCKTLAVWKASRKEENFTNKNIENLVLADFVCFPTKNEPPGPTPSNFRR